MFSGIIETQSTVLRVMERDRAYQLIFQRPQSFDDIELGHSVAVDGVCLTIEGLNEETFTATAGIETLRITKWLASDLEGRSVNMERALKVGDRLHGHWVLGHVDDLAQLESKESLGETCVMTFSLSSKYSPILWSKGSVAVNGVSLTINECGRSFFSVGLIPETLRRTNLGSLSVGENVNIELDVLTRGWRKVAQGGARSGRGNEEAIYESKRSVMEV